MDTSKLHNKLIELMELFLRFQRYLKSIIFLTKYKLLYSVIL